MKLAELVRYLDETLNLKAFPGDRSNNGLQVEGDSEVTKALFAVDASLETFEYAEDAKADFIFVHHGISWGDGIRRFTGITAKRLAVLFNNSMSLYAAHLPLDASLEFGNNAQLCRILGLNGLQSFCSYGGADIGYIGTLRTPLAAEKIAGKLKKALSGAECNFFGDPEAKFKKIAVVSGGGGSAVAEAAEKGAGLLITGEFLHQNYHEAREAGISVLAAGHYATETVGPLAVMEKIRKEFGIEVEFADLPTGL